MKVDALKIDPYVLDTLLRDLVLHSRSPAAFLIYLQLYRHTQAVEREMIVMSHATLAELCGLSKRSVQTAVAHLLNRRLIRQRKTRPTAIPVYTVLTPWVGREK